MVKTTNIEQYLKEPRVKNLRIYCAEDPAVYVTLNVASDGAMTVTSTGGTDSDIIFDSSSGTGDITSTGGLKIATSGSPLSYTAGTPKVEWYFTNAGTSGSTSAEPVYVKSVLTGAGQVGGRARFHTYSNVASGGWVNALKGYMEFGASGSASGLGSAIVGELVLSAGTSSGSYCALEAELVLGTGASTGTATALIYCNATGAGVATFDTNGYLLYIGTGITPAAGKFISANSQTAKCLIEANTRYLVFSQSENGLGIGASGSAVSFSQGSPPFNMYTTCSSTNGSNSVESFYVETTMTGAAGVGGRARFYMTTNVALGGWSNALKANVVYGASGRTTGLGSVFCSELELSAGTSSGTYAALEAEIIAGAGCSTGTATSFLYVNGTDASGLLNDNVVLFEIGAAFTSDAAHMWYDNQGGTPANVEEWVKVKTPAGIRYLALFNAVV